MSQIQLANAKNSLTSSGASVKNFGMSVNSDGSTSFFATLEQSSDAQTKRLEKKQAEKKAAKAKEKKQAEKKAEKAKAEKKAEKAQEKKQAEKKAKEEKSEKIREERKEKQEELRDNTDKENGVINKSQEKEYIKIETDSLEDLIGKVSQYAYDSSSKSVMTEEEKSVGKNFDFKG
jgi:glucan-binding YG repeat protein